MRHVVVRYQVKPERLTEHRDKLRAVFDALAREPLAGLSYTALALDDGLSFVHIAALSTSDGSNPLVTLPAFRAFVADIAERCQMPPSSSEGVVFGSFMATEP